MSNIIEQYVSIWNDKNISALTSLLSKDARYWDTLQEGMALDILSASISATHEEFPDLSFEVLSISHTTDSKYFLAWQMTGTNTGSLFGAPPSGKQISLKGLDSIVVADNKMIAIDSFYDSSVFNL